MGLYEYGPLRSESQIRLMKFHSATSKEVCCSLLTYDLSGAPEYYGLSYCWGQPERPSSILCDGCNLHVSPALYEALLRLETFSQDDAVKYFWIDQICVDQENLNERKHQVQLMRRIYGQARRTLIWLGPYNAELDGDVFALIDRTDKACQTHGDRIVRRNSLAQTRSFGLPDFDSRDWDALTQFLLRPWFRRVWIIQEVALSQRPPLMLGGNTIYPWDRFAHLIRWLERLGYHTITDSVSAGLTSRSLHSIRWFRNEETAQPRLWKLEALLHLVQNLRALDARDHIYALLGLSIDAYQNDSEKVLLPDYRRSYIDVFGMVARYCIAQSNRLAILGEGGVDLDRLDRSKDQNRGLPSWVPRWDRQTLPNTCKKIFHLWTGFVDEDGVVNARIGPERDAAQGTTVQLREMGNERELVLKGLAVDDISWCSDVLKDGDPGSRWETSPVPRCWESALEMLGLEVDPTDSHFQNFARAFYMTVVTGLTIEESSANNEPLRHFWRHLARCYDCGTSESRSSVSPSVLATYERLGEGGDEFRVITALYAKRLFITKSGRFGQGPTALAEQDHIFVLFGGNVPFVLRKVSDGFLFLGEAYVYELMGGEAIAKWREGALRDEWVVLR